METNTLPTYQTKNATSALYKTHFCIPNLEMFAFCILHTLHSAHTAHHTLKLHSNDPPTYCCDLFCDKFYFVQYPQFFR